jgi:hypothetical protein
MENRALIMTDFLILVSLFLAAVVVIVLAFNDSAASIADQSDTVQTRPDHAAASAARSP